MEKITKLNNYVDLVHRVQELGESTGFIVHLDRVKNEKDYKEAFSYEDGTLISFSKYCKDYKDKIYIFKYFRVYEQNKMKGLELMKSHHDYFFNQGVRYLIARVSPLYENREDYKNKTKVKTDTETLINHYIENYTYRGNYVCMKNTNIIVKEMK